MARRLRSSRYAVIEDEEAGAILADMRKYFRFAFSSFRLLVLSTLQETGSSQGVCPLVTGPTAPI